MNQREYELRMELFDLGRKLRDYETDPEDVEQIGKDLMDLSRVCKGCYGEGVDGDMPDANGEGGAIYVCPRCHGECFVFPETEDYGHESA